MTGGRAASAARRPFAPPVQASQAPELPPPTAPPALVVPRPEALPKNWQPFEFNGMTYYLVPLRQ